MDKIIVKGRMIECDSCMSLNPEDKATCKIELSPKELAGQLNWYELINLKQEIDNILADKIMKEKILSYPEAKKESCGICGGQQVYIRGRYPHTDKRLVCPICCQERLDQIRDISDSGYGQASKSI